jgi:hypothetical protein
VNGFPALVIDREKITAVDATTHAPTFKPESEIGKELNQGAIIDTPAVGDLDGDDKPEIVVGTNEEYPETPNSGATSPSGTLVTLLGSLIDLTGGNTRLYALKNTGDPGAVELDDSIFVWKFKVGKLLTELLPVVGEGVTGSPVIGKLSCPGDPDPESPKVGVIPDVGFAYLLTSEGASCYGKSGPNDNALATDFGAGAVAYDHPAIAAVGHPAFGRLDPAGNPAFLAPTAGLLRALDATINEYQGGQDMVGAWDPATSEFRTGFPSPVDDLQFLTGPSVADVNGVPGEEAIAGTASMDLNALSGAGTPGALGWPKFTADWMVANPAIGSFGQDETDAASRQTVIAATRAGDVFAYETAAPACSPASWPRFHHDNANSGELERDAVSPGKPYDVSASGSEIAFKAPGDDLLCGKADAYEVVTSDAPIAGDFSGATPIEPSSQPGDPGSAQKLAIPGDAARYVAFRARDEQGNVGRAVTIDRPSGGAVVGGQPGGEPSPPGAGTTCRDESRPRTVLRRRGIRASRHRFRVHGSSSDAGCAGSGVKRVRVSIARVAKKRCRFLKKGGHLTKRRSCRKPVSITARGKGNWLVRVRGRLPRGRYRVTARAEDLAGNREGVSARRNRVKLRIR